MKTFIFLFLILTTSLALAEENFHVVDEYGHTEEVFKGLGQTCRVAREVAENKAYNQGYSLAECEFEAMETQSNCLSIEDSDFKITSLKCSR